MITIFSAPPMFTEPYYYLPWHMLIEPPEFCVVEFNDPLMPTAPREMYHLAEQAINDWETKLVQSTGYESGWDFTFRTITDNEYENMSLEECSVVIWFERHPTVMEDVLYEGYAYSLFGMSDITIFYLEDKYGPDYTLETALDKTFQEQNLPSLYDNQISPDVEFVLKHEIGHALGLDHPFLENPFEMDYQGIPTASSIMVTHEIYPHLPYDLTYEITDYDVNSVINLYGERGINEYDFEVLVVLVGLGIIAWVVLMAVFVIYVIRRRLCQKTKSLEITGLDDIPNSDKPISDSVTSGMSSSEISNPFRHTKCQYCHRIISNPQAKICQNCGNHI